MACPHRDLGYWVDFTAVFISLCRFRKKSWVGGVAENEDNILFVDK
jgi:hypothetical protein